MQVPERRIDVMSVTDKGGHRYVEHFAEFPQRFRQDRRRSAERIAGFRIDDGDVSVLDYALQLPDEGHVGGKFALADTAYVPQQPFAADKAVDGDDIIRPPRENGLDN